MLDGMSGPVEQIDLKLIAGHSPSIVATAISSAVATPIGAPVHAGSAVDTVAAIAITVAAIAVPTRIAVIACGAASDIGPIPRGASITTAIDTPRYAPVVAILRGGMTDAE
jgi:hypothetical protein